MTAFVCPRCGLPHAADTACLELVLRAGAEGTPLTTGTVLVGRFLITRIVHHGSSSVVYLAQDQLKGGRATALKELRFSVRVDAEGEREAEAWFARESSLLGSLRHRLMPTFYGAFREGQHPYIAQEYIEGETLDALVGRAGPVPEGQAIAWGRAICDLLAYLHGRPEPVIFRDLKPANIIVRAATSTLVVVDFGIATPSSAGRVGTTIGTPGYAPPEQYQGLATPESDIYALGATLHRLLTGYDPEQGPAFTFPPIGDLNPAISPRLSAVVARAVQLSPAARYPSARHLDAALAEVAPAMPFTWTVAGAPAPGTPVLRGASAGGLPSPARWWPVLGGALLLLLALGFGLVRQHGGTVAPPAVAQPSSTPGADATGTFAPAHLVATDLPTDGASATDVPTIVAGSPTDVPQDTALPTQAAPDTALPTSGPTSFPLSPSPGPMSSLAPAEHSPDADAAVAYQITTAHDGFALHGLTLPLRQRWSVDLKGKISYPLIVGDAVYVTVAIPGAQGTELFARDRLTGAALWGPIALAGTYFWSALAYDGGRVFALSDNGMLRAFDARTGALIWAAAFDLGYVSSPPTARGGIVYIASGSWVVAVDEGSGVSLGSTATASGDSAPVVDDGGMYLAYSCRAVSPAASPSGRSLWHSLPFCVSGSGKVAVLHQGKLYLRDFFASSPILDVATGKQVGTHDSTVAPAFSGSTGFYLTSGTLRAVDTRTGAVLWSFADPGTLTTAPLVAGRAVYVASGSGHLYALSPKSGAVLSSVVLASGVDGPGEQHVLQPLTGMAAAEGTLVVPAGTMLVALS